MTCVWSCIVRRGQTWTVGVTGATGYAGGEVCRLLAGHPNLRLAGVHANVERRPTPGRAAAAPAAVRRPRGAAQRRRGRWPATTSSSWRCRTASPRPIAAQLPDDTLVIDCGADHRLNDPAALGPLVRRRARRLLALRAARAARPAGAAGGRPADRRPRLLPDLGHPRDGPGARRRAGRARTSSWSPPAARAAPASRPSRTCSAREVMGAVSAYGVGGVHRHTPEMVQNLSQAAGRRR